MSKIITHPPSKQYDDGWDAIFGKKRPLTGEELATKYGFEALSPEQQAANLDAESRRAALKELTRLTEEAGGYDAEMLPSGHTKLPGGGVRCPRGCKCHVR